MDVGKSLTGLIVATLPATLTAAFVTAIVSNIVLSLTRLITKLPVPFTTVELKVISRLAVVATLVAPLAGKRAVCVKVGALVVISKSSIATPASCTPPSDLNTNLKATLVLPDREEASKVLVSKAAIVPLKKALPAGKVVLPVAELLLYQLAAVVVPKVVQLVP